MLRENWNIFRQDFYEAALKGDLYVLCSLGVSTAALHTFVTCCDWQVVHKRLNLSTICGAVITVRIEGTRCGVHSLLRSLQTLKERFFVPSMALLLESTEILAEAHCNKFKKWTTQPHDEWATSVHKRKLLTLWSCNNASLTNIPGDYWTCG